MATTKERTRTSAETDTTKCVYPECGDARSEHSLDGKTCFADKAKKDEPAHLTCPCRGFAANSDELAYRTDGSGDNSELPDSGPVTVSDIERDDDGTLNASALKAAIETVGRGETSKAAIKDAVADGPVAASDSGGSAPTSGGSDVAATTGGTTTPTATATTGT